MGDHKGVHEPTKNTQKEKIMSSYYTYILRCADDTLYTGITTDLDRRLMEHNSDNQKWAKYTRIRRPVELVHHEVFSTRSDACKREYEIKQFNKTEKVLLINTIKKDPA